MRKAFLRGERCGRSMERLEAGAEAETGVERRLTERCMENASFCMEWMRRLRMCVPLSANGASPGAYGAKTGTSKQKNAPYDLRLLLCCYGILCGGRGD